jgi:hypothetical protein
LFAPQTKRIELRNHNVPARFLGMCSLSRRWGDEMEAAGYDPFCSRSEQRLLLRKQGAVFTVELVFRGIACLPRQRHVEFVWH